MFAVDEMKDEVDRVELGFYIDCSSAAHPSIKCSVNQQKVTVTSQIPTAQDTLTIAGFASDISTSLIVVIMKNRFRNPPSTRPITTIVA